uniref:Nmad3 family putative nucleotide modification protein n=1 Tax=Parerythrobacter lutipelagi TaxID=1964208 RepID=UPI0010F9726B|nr:hypothetical protein [Parerythrobacter lutipelagi]
MRIIFSRKGFDSAAGGGPSPIVDGRPVSLPIPSGGYSRTTYGDLGLGDLASEASRGRFGSDELCHHDPMFLPEGKCLFGQCGAAQTHLDNQHVGKGDVFLFFGLFREEATGERHHRIFGYLQVEHITRLAACEEDRIAEFAAHHHPHAIGMHARNDVIYSGPGETARRATSRLRLSIDGGPPSRWTRPAWLKRGGLTYHDRADRWIRGGMLRSVARGQEFVADIGQRAAPRDWLESILTEITGRSSQ